MKMVKKDMEIKRNWTGTGLLKTKGRFFLKLSPVPDNLSHVLAFSIIKYYTKNLNLSRKKLNSLYKFFKY
jgi:hypothetical protein